MKISTNVEVRIINSANVHAHCPAFSVKYLFADSSDGTSSSDSEDDFETPPSSPSNHRIRKEPDRRHQDWRLQLSHTFDWMEKRLVAEPRRPGNLTKVAFVPPTDCSQGKD